MTKMMDISVNQSIEVHVADTFKQRLLGYMFQKEPKYDALLIRPCSSIHTFFMRFPIDVLFLNEEKIIVKRYLSLKPGKVIMPVKNAKMVLEAEAGGFTNYHIGEKLELK